MAQMLEARDYKSLISACKNVRPGGTILVFGGDYSWPDTAPERARIAGRSGSEAAPITIRAADAAWIDCGRAGDHEWRKPYNAQNPSPQKSSPPKPGNGDFALLQIDESSHVIVDGLKVRGCWPTIFYVQDSQHVAIRRCVLEGATYAIYAKSTDDAVQRRVIGGRRHSPTSHLRIERNRWRQDTTPDHDLWHSWSWVETHGGEGGSGTKRQFNGGFLSGKDVLGYVIVRKNLISDCYNGVRLKCGVRDGTDTFGARYNAHVHIVDNDFIRCRDNPTEQEEYSYDWHIRHNRIFDCHSWFSMDGSRGGYWYIYGNTGTFKTRQGLTPEGAGDPQAKHTVGRVLKLSYESAVVRDGVPEEGKTGVPDKPWYVFNNSWRLRCPLIGGSNELGTGGEGPDFTANLTFANNAMEWPAAPAGKDWLSTPMEPVLNFDLAKSGRLTFDYDIWSGWGGYDFKGGLDPVVHEGHGIRVQGPVFAPGNTFDLAAASPGRNSGRADLPMTTADGVPAPIATKANGKLDRGAMQDGRLVSVPALDALYAAVDADIGLKDREDFELVA